MSEMRFAVTLNPFLEAATVLDEVRLAERTGYDAVWIADSQLIWREVYVLLGAAATATSRVMLGTSVTNPVTRHAAVTASAIMTLQELSGGRMRLGIGVGDSSLKTMGMQSATRAELQRYVEIVRWLCNGESIDGPAGSMKLAFGSADNAPPIIIAGAGPKMLETAGEIADGVMLSGRARNDSVLEAMLEHLNAGRARSGRPDGEYVKVVGVAGAVHEDGHLAKVAVRPHVARGLLLGHWGLSESTRRVSELVKERYDYTQHMNPSAPQADVVPDEVVPEFAIAGTPEECIQQIRGLVEAGISEVTIYPYAIEGRPRTATIEAFARDVMSAFR